MTGTSIAPSRGENAPGLTGNGSFIAFRADRLGARIVSLMNAMRLAADAGTGFKCAWTESAGVGHVFNNPKELFAEDFVARHFLETDAWRQIRPASAVLTGQMQRDPVGVAAAISAGQNVVVGNAFGVINLAGEDEARSTERFRAQFGKIAFSPAVSHAMRQLDAALADHTAYHIRRGDLTDDVKAMNKPWPHKMVPNEFYELHMERVLESREGGAILFSDDEASIAHYSTLFPSLKTITGIIDMSSLTEAQRDLIELYAMSRCSLIIAPDRSAFSSTAADLSGAIKQSVTQSMTETQREAAYQALFMRLRDRPASFSGPGEIGQSIAHVVAWLERADRWEDAASLCAEQIRSGLDISFVYPQTMRCQHRADDPKAVLKTARTMARRPLIYVKDQAKAEILHGYAHLRLGNRVEGLRRMANAFWHSSGVPGAKTLLPVLVESGWLTPSNFLPVQRTQFELMRRRGPLKTLFEDYPSLNEIGQIVIPEGIGSLEPVTWDWAPLMRGLSIQAEARRGIIDRFAKLLEKVPDDDTGRSAREGQAAIFNGFLGDLVGATDTLCELTRNTPDDPFHWQRLSHARWMARDFQGAAQAGRKLAELRPNWPAMRAWTGMTLLRARKFEAAAEHLAVASAAQIGLPSIHWLHAESLHRLGKRSEAIEAIELALELAPLEVDFVMLYAKLCENAGLPDLAADRMIRVVDAHRAPGKLFVQLINLLRRAGDSERAASYTEIAFSRAPQNPAILALMEDAA